MGRMIGLTLSSLRHRLAILCMAVCCLPACAVMEGIQRISSPYPVHPDSSLERNTFPIVEGSDVIGRFAVIRLREGDTLPDIARHFSLGLGEISAANPGIDVWVPRAGERIMLPLRFILPDAPRKGIVINVASLRLFQYGNSTDSGPSVVKTYPVGVGTTERPTPLGQMYVERKVTRPTWYVPATIAEDHRKKGDPLPAQVPPGPENPLGEYALYLSRSSYLIHGTNKPASIGMNATNGCLRLYPEDIRKLYESTPVNTSVSIVNQPYLVGQRNGIVYLEVHAPLEGSNPGELKKMYAKLQTIEKHTGRTLDWDQVEKVLDEARGVPVPILELEPGRWVERTIEVEHPGTLYGRPEVPELKPEAWYVWAADLDDRTQALRIAAIMNHQGPQIPARVLSRSTGYRVLAGPFDTRGEAREAARRLKIDLEIDGVVIEPSRVN